MRIDITLDLVITDKARYVWSVKLDGLQRSSGKSIDYANAKLSIAQAVDHLIGVQFPVSSHVVPAQP